MPNVQVGGFQPVSGFGYDRPYQDGIFIRSQFMDNMRLAERENEMKIINAFGEKLGAAKSRPGTRFLVPTQSNLAVGDIVDAVTTSAYSYPNFVATTSPAVTQLSTFSRKIGSGSSVLGIPLPLQAPNEGQIELIVNQYRGAAMIFTRQFIETCMGYVKNPSAAYSQKLRYAMTNDIEEYCWLTFLYTGPITNTAGDYGTGLNSFTDSIGISNQTNYALTRTLTSINGASNLITPSATGAFGLSMSNSGNARFTTANVNVPWLFGSTGGDISFDTVARLEEAFNKRNVPLTGRSIICEPKGFNDIIFLPQFSNNDFYTNNSPDTFALGKAPGKILTFNVDYTNVIQPAGAASNVLYEIAAAKGALLYEMGREPELIIDNRMDKPEMAIIVMGSTRYGAVIQRPDHAAVIQTRIRP